jgi:hypothetical protein
MFEMGPGPAIRSPDRRARVTLPIFRVRRTILRPSRMRDLRPKNSLRNSVAQATVEVIRQCGDDLTRENIMKQAANLDLALPMLLPGIKVKTSSTDYFPIEGQRLQRFTGETWELFGEVIGQ